MPNKASKMHIQYTKTHTYIWICGQQTSNKHQKKRNQQQQHRRQQRPTTYRFDTAPHRNFATT